MVSKRYHTLVIMPSTPGKRIVKFSLPSLCWPVFLVMLAGLICWSGLGTWSLYQHKQITDRSLTLLKENLLARGKIEDQRKKIAYLNNELEEIFAAADDIRADVTRLSTSEPTHLSYTSPPSWLSTLEVTELHTDLNRIIETLHDRQKEMEYTPSISPVDPRKSWISSLFGMRISPFTGRKHFHLGVDIAGWKGTPIMAPAKGKVIGVGKYGSLGLTVRIKHSSTYTTEYGHLLKGAVKKGQSVERGEIIGYMGNSGRSTGYHLHYGLKKSGKHVDPLPYMMDWDKNYFRFPEGDNETAKK
jgi:murein DD-endopeptidase MepM/ murein hydrolase activator NlpD